MSRIRTASNFQDELDGEFAWRLKEIDDMRAAARTDQTTRRRTLLRAGVALLYAHWEGFIKNSSEFYLNYLVHQGVLFKDLRKCLVALGLRGHLSVLTESKQPVSSHDALDFVLNQLSKPAKLPFRDAIDTKSNLSSGVFQSIAGWLGIETGQYETKFHLIDAQLLERRNKIAHGEFVDLNLDDYLVLTDQVIELMRWYKTDLENAVALKSYLALQVLPTSAVPSAVPALPA